MLIYSNYIVYKRGKKSVYQRSNLTPILTMTTHFVEMDVILLRCSTRKILR